MLTQALVLLAPTVEILCVYVQLAQNCAECAGRNVASTVSGDGGKPLVGRVPPNLVRARGLTHELTAQLVQPFSQFPAIHSWSSGDQYINVGGQMHFFDGDRWRDALFSHCFQESASHTGNQHQHFVYRIGQYQKPVERWASCLVALVYPIYDDWELIAFNFKVLSNAHTVMHLPLGWFDYTRFRRDCNENLCSILRRLELC